MKEKIIKEAKIEGDLIFARKIVLEKDCFVTGKLSAKFYCLR